MKVIASHNGLNATKCAMDLMKDGATTLDACIEGVSLVEDDPDDLTVGYGGLPNEDGVVELDAAVMDGATHRGGAVAALRNMRHPTKVAKLVMQQTERVLLVGEGALKFALANGFVEENLLTDRARRMWHYWKRTLSEKDDWIAPSSEDIDLDVQRYFEKNFYSGGTVHCAGLDDSGDLACATSTSGHAFKLSGRVGDSAMLGAGLYVDNDVGSCGAIGHGEATMENLSSFHAVQLMRDGHAPVDVGLAVLRRVAEKTPPQLLDENGIPRFDLQLYLLAKDGTHAGVAMRGTKRIAVSDDQGSRLEQCVTLQG